MPAGKPELPDRIAPMLARIGQPFDSEEHLFEVKWDGVRALAFVDGDGYRLHSRHRTDLRGRYPELEFLADLPPGCVLDGELVVLREDGRPDFRAAISREQARDARRAASLARSSPVTYVVFDLLYRDFEPLLQHPLSERRAALVRVVGNAAQPRLVLSEGVVGTGKALFEAVAEKGLEGVVAKRLDSRYRPGERTDLWLKLKPVRYLHCAILGFEPNGERDFKSLIIATNDPEGLRCVGRVGSGLTEKVKARLRELLFARLRDDPWVETGLRGRWVEPGLYCTVSYLERTDSGALRAPVFVELVEEQ